MIAKALMKFNNALVVKLVDTTDLKSVPFWSASSSLAEGTSNNYSHSYV